MRIGREKKRPKIIGLPDFWDVLSRHGNKLLALDYDGTLAPFCVQRMQAYPYPGIPGALERIHRRADTMLAIISGRPLAEVLILAGSFNGIVIGSHGMEKRLSSGDMVIKTVNREQREGLSCIQRAAEEIGLQGLPIELKPASVALHTRGLDPKEAARLEDLAARLWRDISSRHGLEVRRFNGGVEVRATGWNKGDALEELRLGMPSGSACVYIGDNDTDEDAFLKIRSHGYGIRVGDAGRPTAARGFLPDIPAVREFLEAWADFSLPAFKGDISWIQDG